jgi:hypothetical protein
MHTGSLSLLTASLHTHPPHTRVPPLTSTKCTAVTMRITSASFMNPYSVSATNPMGVVLMMTPAMGMKLHTNTMSDSRPSPGIDSAHMPTAVKKVLTSAMRACSRGRGEGLGGRQVRAGRSGGWPCAWYIWRAWVGRLRGQPCASLAALLVLVVRAWWPPGRIDPIPYSSLQQAHTATPIHAPCRTVSEPLCPFPFPPSLS